MSGRFAIKVTDGMCDRLGDGLLFYNRAVAMKSSQKVARIVRKLTMGVMPHIEVVAA